MQHIPKRKYLKCYTDRKETISVVFLSVNMQKSEGDGLAGKQEVSESSSMDFGLMPLKSLN